RAEGGGTRSWWRRASTGDVAEGRGVLRTVPDLTLRWAWKPAPLSVSGAVVSNVGASARMLRQLQTATAPADSLAPEDARSTLLRSWPVTGTVTWAALGGLTTSGGLTMARRTDDLPGSRTASTTRDANAEATRAFKPPTRWGLKSDIRGRIGWQASRTRTLVNGLDPLGRELPSFDLLNPFGRIVQADLGRRSLSFGANSDVAENMTLGLTGARVTTFNRNFGTQVTQTVLSAVLQLNFFSGSFR
ncbi:MAG: hypothetical protein JO180_00005, partial [Gemmatirosa sp.]|nr:hypothetical protein [Gemmatirosa sp.]